MFLRRQKIESECIQIYYVQLGETKNTIIQTLLQVLYAYLARKPFAMYTVFLEDKKLN